MDEYLEVDRSSIDSRVSAWLDDSLLASFVNFHYLAVVGSHHEEGKKIKAHNE
jgi:hypothetical protein